jgi:hypothetical protein
MPQGLKPENAQALFDSIQHSIISVSNISPTMYAPRGNILVLDFATLEDAGRAHYALAKFALNQ